MASKSVGKLLTHISRRKTGTVATLTISRPDKLNALSSHIMREIPKTVSEVVQQNKDLLAVVLTGHGTKAFVGGADINEMATLTTPEVGRAFITTMHHACKSLRECPVPVIGRLNGYTLGGGLELAVSCDFRVASRNAVFGMPEVKVGVPSVVEAALITSLIGWGRTRRLFYLGDKIGAEEAERWGLVEKVVEDQEKLDEAVEQWLVELEECGPRSIKIQKEMMRRWENVTMEEAIRNSIDFFGRSFETEEGSGGVSEPQRMTREVLAKLAARKSKL
ncbi:hypothetical protein Z517_02858 [Fonsecaea pedrosoi CBS 271.37]|uniref:Enoyl-CoA hydratase n=1 Tax=Fonsecaea pedrosoi CBS 271.37 TaxID=1442368 RepID=A0A0D2FAE2_9EURO|nr:uncharacterized protein Z517_02858 [Fonsecaea pedrosoi CBS 271.37]KIW83612.1 hypothetical protein Z517_02858 [Fonsecaea pedrosoi CBS 271.37]